MDSLLGKLIWKVDNYNKVNNGPISMILSEVMKAARILWYSRIQNENDAKAKKIKKNCGVLKVAFIINKAYMWQTLPLFEEMRTYSQFDPYIFVTPAIANNELRKKDYDALLNQLSKKYSTRVIGTYHNGKVEDLISDDF